MQISSVELKITFLEHGRPFRDLAYQTEHASGIDIRAALDAPFTLRPGERALIPTGFCLEVPPDYEVQVRPRSGLAIKHGVTLLNSPGTIDADYRGEVKVILINHSAEPFILAPGERIDQMVLCRVERARLREVENLSDTARGEGGFGSTGR